VPWRTGVLPERKSVRGKTAYDDDIEVSEITRPDFDSFDQPVYRNEKVDSVYSQTPSSLKHVIVEGFPLGYCLWVICKCDRVSVICNDIIDISRHQSEWQRRY